MRDKFGRQIDYVRLSLTDRCDLRCRYCLPAKNVCFLPQKQLLTNADFLFLVENLAKLGVKKLKITGGEPLIRPGAIALIKEMKTVPGIQSVTLTTNGTQLEKYAEQLASAGLDGLNLSLDTLDAAVYEKVTRGGNLAQVLRGIQKVQQLNLPNLKINAVNRQELTNQEIVELVSLARDADIQVRFIELMPLGMGKVQDGRAPAEVMAAIEEYFGPLIPYQGRLGNGPARYYELADFKGKVGFINALENCFCESCDRMRILATGTLKTCLHLDHGRDLQLAIRQRNSNLLQQQILEAIAEKPERHQFLKESGEGRWMSQIGG